MSGCSLKLVGNGLVRKTSPSEPYNERLRRQAKKQEFFSEMDFRNICVPRVAATGDSGGLFHFDMEYSPGLGMREFLSLASVRELEFVAETFSRYLHQAKSMSRAANHERQIMAKIEELAGKTGRKELLGRLALMVRSGGSTLPKSACHGDLTLANVLFQKNKLCLVDFLDSYVDSYLCDLAKLKQDLFYLWTPAVAGFLDVRTTQSCGFLWRILEKEFGEEMATDGFAVIDTINLLRVEPYVRTEPQRAALESALRRGGHL